MFALPSVVTEVPRIKGGSVAVIPVVSMGFQVKVINDRSCYVGVHAGEYLLGPQQVLAAALLSPQHEHDQIRHCRQNDGIAETDDRRSVDNHLIESLAPRRN